MGTIKSFTDLKAWRASHQLILAIYKLTDAFPEKEKYSLTDQIRRASVSITSNIAEGFGRQTYKDKIKFYHQANGSIFEVKNQLIIARDLGYVKLDNNLLVLCNSAHKLLHGLINASKKRI